MSDFHSQGIRWLFSVHILPRKAVLKERGFKPSFFDKCCQELEVSLERGKIGLYASRKYDVLQCH